MFELSWWWFLNSKEQSNAAKNTMTLYLRCTFDAYNSTNICCFMCYCVERTSHSLPVMAMPSKSEYILKLFMIQWSDCINGVEFGGCNYYGVCVGRSRCWFVRPSKASRKIMKDIAMLWVGGFENSMKRDLMFPQRIWCASRVNGYDWII